MADFSVIGRVIDAHRNPVVGYRAHVYRAAGTLGSDEHLVDGLTDDGGRFSLTIPHAALAGLSARLGRAPQVLLKLVDPSDRTVLTSRAHPIDWQLEYRVYLGGGQGLPDPPDLYAHGIRRMIGEARQSGMMSGMGKKKGRKSPDLRAAGGWAQQLALLNQGAWIADKAPKFVDNADLMFAVMDGVATDKVESGPVKILGYDGAQVPRQPWKQPDDQVIIWPRKEPFKWG